MKTQRTRPSSRTGARTDSLRGRLESEGALAMGLRRLHRQVAHELRRPLNSISLHAALLGRAARGELDGVEDAEARQNGWLRAIEADVARLDGDLERWTRLLAGDGEAPERVALRGVVEETQAVLASLAARRAIVLEARLPDSEIFVEVARGELIRLLVALAGASMEASSRGAQLRLVLDSGAAEATIEAVAESGSVELAGGEPVVAAVISGLAGAFEAMGGRLEPSGSVGWLAAWPITRSGRETARDTDD